MAHDLVYGVVYRFGDGGSGTGIVREIAPVGANKTTLIFNYILSFFMIIRPFIHGH